MSEELEKKYVLTVGRTDYDVDHTAHAHFEIREFDTSDEFDQNAVELVKESCNAGEPDGLEFLLNGRSCRLEVCLTMQFRAVDARTNKVKLTGTQLIVTDVDHQLVDLVRTLHSGKVGKSLGLYDASESPLLLENKNGQDAQVRDPERAEPAATEFVGHCPDCGKPVACHPVLSLRVPAPDGAGRAEAPGTAGGQPSTGANLPAGGPEVPAAEEGQAGGHGVLPEGTPDRTDGSPTPTPNGA